MSSKNTAKKTATAKVARVKCRALVECEVEVSPARPCHVAKGGLIQCDKATAELLKDKLEVIGAVSE